MNNVKWREENVVDRNKELPNNNNSSTNNREYVYSTCHITHDNRIFLTMLLLIL